MAAQGRVGAGLKTQEQSWLRLSWGVSPPAHNPPGLGVCPPAAPSLMPLFDWVQRGTGACQLKKRVPGTAEAPECRLWKLGRGPQVGEF